MKKILAAMLAVCLLLGMTACGAKEESNLEKITFGLDWTPNTNHTGLYVAMEKGWFREEGIEVEVVQPPADGAEVLVASGNAQFGVSFQDYIAPALVGEEPLPITAVAAVLQHNDSGIISRKGEGMDTPGGMEGKKYATWDLPVEKATIRSVVEADGGDFSKVQLIPSTVTDEVSALQSGSVDAIWIYYGWAGVACNVAGLETDYFAFADIDPAFDYYTPVIIGNNAYLEENPQAAKAFLRALSKGYAFAAELAGSSDLVYASQEYLADKYTADAARWGEFDPARWSAFFTWLNENDLLEAPVDVNAGFTNDYLS